MGATAEFLTSTLSYKAPASADGWAQPVHGSLQTIAACVEEAQGTVTSPTGIVSSYNHVATTEAPIPYNSRVWFAGSDTGNDSEGHLVVGIKDSSAPDGFARVVELYLGSQTNPMVG
jgi:hypothetical protein